MHIKTRLGQGFARFGDHGVLRHANHHLCVLLHCLLHFGDDVLLVLSDGVADGGVNVVGGEYGAVNGGVQSGGEGSLRCGSVSDWIGFWYLSRDGRTVSHFCCVNHGRMQSTHFGGIAKRVTRRWLEIAI